MLVSVRGLEVGVELLVEGCLCLFQTIRPSDRLRKEPELFAKGVVKTGGEQPFHILIV